MKKLFALTALTVGLALSGQALAHGAKAKHGGVVQSAGDLSFELVNKDGKAVIYVEDHGADLSTKGATGKLTVLTGAKKSQAVLVPTGTNSLSSSTALMLGAKAKAVASISLPGKEPISVRFATK